ncbi:hypothetical protein BLOT_002618 [Blomia tropicalis]|nr:hypothetical protein BLOT_002618 [Blomia tropicalis]
MSTSMINSDSTDNEMVEWLMDELFFVLNESNVMFNLKPPSFSSHYCQQLPMRYRRLPSSFFIPPSQSFNLNISNSTLEPCFSTLKNDNKIDELVENQILDYVRLENINYNNTLSEVNCIEHQQTIQNNEITTSENMFIINNLNVLKITYQGCHLLIYDC